MCQMRSVSTSRQPFWNISPEDAYRLLFQEYKDVVQERGKTFWSDAETIRHIKEVANFLTNPSDKHGVYLGGKCGNGKTTMLSAFYRVCRKLKIPILNTSAPRMVRWHLDGHNIMDVPHQEKAICIDDLGTEPAESVVYGNRVFVMTDFFEEAYRCRMFLFVTSNLGANEITERYGERVRDRFREIFFVVKFSNPSFRK